MTQIRKEELTPQEEKYLIEYNIKFSKTRSEFDEDKENRELSRQLNKTAFCIITALVVIVLSHFIYLLINKTDISFSEGVMSINSDIEQINFQNNNIDNQTITLILKKLKEVEKSIIHKEEIFKDDARFLIVVVGSIFAVVGFFGFKSIFDTRQAAIDKAVTEAKESAKTKASEVAEETAKKTAKKTAEKTAEKTTKIAVENYLSNNLEHHIKDIEKNLTQISDNQTFKINERIDKLENPIHYKLPFIIELQKEIDTLNSKINSITNTISNLETQNSNLTEKLPSLTTELNTIKTSIDTFKNEITTKIINHYEEYLKKLKYIDKTRTFHEETSNQIDNPNITSN